MLDLKVLVVEGQALHTTTGHHNGLSIPIGIGNLSIAATYNSGDSIARVIGWSATNPEGDLLGVAIFSKEGVWAPKKTYYVLICDPAIDCLQLIEVISDENTPGWKPGVALTLAQILEEAEARCLNLEEVQKTFYQMDYDETGRHMVKSSFTIHTNVYNANLNWNAFQGFLEAIHSMGLNPIHSEACDPILHEEESGATPYSHGNGRALIIGQHGVYRQTSGCRFQILPETEIQPGVSWVEADSCLAVRMGGTATTYHTTKEELAVSGYTTIGQAIRKCYIKIGSAACVANFYVGAINYAAIGRAIVKHQ